VKSDDIAALTRESRTLMGDRQERWLFDGSGRRSARDRLAHQSAAGDVLAAGAARAPVVLNDVWMATRRPRAGVNFIDKERIRDVAILSGDIHSSWAFNVPRNPWDGYTAASGEGSLAVEIVAPASARRPGDGFVKTAAS